MSPRVTDKEIINGLVCLQQIARHSLVFSVMLYDSLQFILEKVHKTSHLMPKIKKHPTILMYLADFLVHRGLKS